MTIPDAPRVQPPVVSGGVISQAPISTGWEAPHGPPPDVDAGIDQLSDVDAPPDVVGVLERQADQRVRPVSRAALIADHVQSPTPHPAYDELPSLTLLFQNRLI